MRSRSISALVVCALAAVSATAGGSALAQGDPPEPVPVPTPADAAEPEQVSLSDEGLRMQEAAERHLIASYGLSAEDAELRASQELLLAELGTRVLGGGAVAFRIEQTRTRINIRVIASPGEVDAIRRLAEQQAEDLGLRGVTILVEAGRLAKTDLQVGVDRIDEALSKKGIFAAVGLERGSGRIVVSPAELDDRTRAEVNTIVSSLGLGADLVDLEQGEAPATVAGGGERLAYPVAGRGCTSGFAVRDVTGPAILTAGHCENEAPILRDTSQGLNSAVPLGAAIVDGFNAVARRDTQFHRVAPPVVADPAIVRNAANQRRVVVGAVTVAAGSNVCKMGRTIGDERCGEVNFVGERTVGGVALLGFAVATFETQQGDSGGPVYVGTRAAGTVTSTIFATCTLFNPDGSCNRSNNGGFTLIAHGLNGTNFTLLAPNSLRYTSVTPARLLDTRTTGGAISGGTTRDVSVTGVANVPTTARAVVLNVTSVNQASAGFLRIYPAGDLQPAGASASYQSTTVAQQMTVPVGQSGRITVFASATTDVIIDVQGYYRDSGSRVDLLSSPQRAYDSRSVSALGAGQTRDVVLTSVPSTATSVIVNITAIAPTQATFLTAFRPSTNLPGVSNVNAVDGQVISNLAYVQSTDSGANEAIRIHNAHGSTHFAIDVLGYFSSVGELNFTALPVTRFADSRANLNISGPITAGQTRTVAVGNLASLPIIPDGATGVLVRVTSVNATEGTHLTVTPNGGSSTSTVNSGPGLLRSNHTVVRLIWNQLSIFNAAGQTDVVIDIEGYFYNPD